MNPTNKKEDNKGVSERRLAANRENAKKSTGPRTIRGKSYSRLNATRHDATAKLLQFDDADSDLKNTSDRLHELYGRGDPRTEMAIEMLVIGEWRKRKGLESEMASFSANPTQPHDAFLHGAVPAIQRYNNENARAMIRAYEVLDKLYPNAAQDAADRVGSIEDDCSAADQVADPEPEGEPPALTLVPTNCQPTPAPEEETAELNEAHPSPEGDEGSDTAHTEETNSEGDEADLASTSVFTDNENGVDDEQVE